MILFPTDLIHVMVGILPYKGHIIKLKTYCLRDIFICCLKPEDFCKKDTKKSKIPKHIIVDLNIVLLIQ
jgi:hypothetical protein